MKNLTADWILGHFQTLITQKLHIAPVWNFNPKQIHPLSLTYQKISPRFSALFEIFHFLWTLLFQKTNIFKIRPNLKLCFSTTKRARVNLKIDYERYFHTESKYVSCIFVSQDTKKLYTFLYNPKFLYFAIKSDF